MSWFDADKAKYENLATAWVESEPSRCVQCGVCVFNCPIGIDVRRHVWQGEPVKDSRCLTCGECIKRCPRGLLYFGRAGVAVPARRQHAAPSGVARRHVLIGSGPASVAAAQAIRECDPHAEITMVGAEPDGYYSRPGLAYYLAREEREASLFPFSRRELSDLGVRLVHARAEGIDRASQRVMLADGGELAYDRLLIATGSRAIPIGVPGAELDGVVKLDDLDDARDLIGRSRRAKAAVVVGGGITALEIVEGLRARRVQVHYLMRKDHYWSNVLSPSESSIVEEGLRDRGVQMHRFTELAGVRGRQGRVAAAVTDSGTEIPCDLLAVAVGVRPQTELALAAGLECGRGILVDEHLRASDERIFAAGDVAEVCDAGTDRRTLEVLWNSAVEKGRVAGLNMAADEPVNVYDKGAAPLNVTRLAGFKITIIGRVGGGEGSDLKGLTRGASQVWEEPGATTVVESRAGDAHVRLAVEGNRIAGAVIMGDQALSFPLQKIIRSGVDVSSIASRLSTPGAPIAEIVTQFWRQVEVHDV